MRLFRRSDVPLDRDASGRILPWLVAVMVYLAALALVCAMTLNRAVRHWEGGLSGSWTIQIPRPDAGASRDKDDVALERVLDLLLATPGVTGAEVLAPDEIRRLLDPWLGAGAAAPDLPVPHLVAVIVDPDRTPERARLAEALARIAPGASVDDHEEWLGRIRGLARALQLVAAFVVVVIAGSAVLTVIFATRMGLSVHGPVIQLLHLIGARDTYVAKQFQAHALTFALRGGIIGLGFAVLTVFLVGRGFAGSQAVPLPTLELQPIDWSVLTLLPIVIAVVAMLTARLTVLRTLKRLP